MLKTKTLIEKLGQEYAPMLKEVNIPDFTKCIAQYAGLDIQDIKDEVIEEYLTKWATSKKYIYDLFGAIKVDMPIEYKEEDVDYREAILEIGRDYPIYYPWLDMFSHLKENKISDVGSYRMYEVDNLVKKCFPGYVLAGTTLTHFLRSKLNAPEELVTKIGRIFENQAISATYTLSIDPVDIMLSSENPYNWVSCYRLSTENSESHADGCLAGVLDEATIVTYIWNNEGKFDLYNNYTFKNIRYKKIRMTIAVNKNFTAIHFNTPYPGKANYSDSFKQLLRVHVEDYIDKKLERVGLLWRRSEFNSAYNTAYRRHDEYGYGEYSGSNVYVLNAPVNYEEFHIYNETITCPCGCKEDYIGTQNCKDMCYSGEGHINDNFYYEHYCEIQDEYIDCDGDCRNCAIWCRENPVCELDINHYCDRDAYEAENEGDLDPYRSNIMYCNPDHCATCPLYKLHHPEEADLIEEE